MVLALIAGVRLVTFKQPIDWLTVGLIVVAAVAAIAHRNAVAGLEVRGRGEAESFARILHGLSRSVSAEAIVSAILDDLIDATAADHVVLVRRRPGASSLEATLVTRRAGVPHTTSSLPLSLLDPSPAEASREEARPRDAVPVGPGLAGSQASGAQLGAGPVGAAPVRPPAAEFVLLGAGSGGAGGSASDVAVDPARLDGVGASEVVDSEAVEAPLPKPPVRVRMRLEMTRRGARRASDVGFLRTIVRRAAAESLALLKDLGIPMPDLLGARGTAKPTEVLARGGEATVAERVATRVQSAFGLSHTLTAPLRAEHGVIGAIVLSRRDRHAWPEGARRLVRGAAAETAAALERADSYREATAGASTDPLTGLPNRRYFDEFSSLLTGRRRAGDAVAVLMVDIDKFKGLNDAYGHPTGDQVLRSVAGAITAAVRDQDVPARIGGEEFAVLLRNPGPSVALEVGERVRQAVRDLDLADIGVPGVSVSVGVADARGPDEPIEALVDRADQALLRAKRAGRNRVIAG
jgi:diguanylate cyclase (GGDEF)-like protein